MVIFNNKQHELNFLKAGWHVLYKSPLIVRHETRDLSLTGSQAWAIICNYVPMDSDITSGTTGDWFESNGVAAPKTYPSWGQWDFEECGKWIQLLVKRANHCGNMQDMQDDLRMAQEYLNAMQRSLDQYKETAGLYNQRKTINDVRRERGLDPIED